MLKWLNKGLNILRWPCRPSVALLTLAGLTFRETGETQNPGIFSRRTNHTQGARVNSHNGPIRRRKRGYILTADQSLGRTSDMSPARFRNVSTPLEISSRLSSCTNILRPAYYYVFGLGTEIRRPSRIKNRWEKRILEN
eukprot:1189054-Prorocentrum_minimum.AAC.2